MISIVIPLYNKEGLIGNTLRTVLAQTYQDFEIVIVNDGSTDHSVDEVAGFTDPRIRLINQQNAGVSAARNRGIAEAKGEYIALLDADDEWKPDYLETQMSLAEQYPEASVFAVNYEFRDNYGKVTPTILRNIRFEGDCGIMDNYFEVASTSHPPICSISIMARKGVFESVGDFPVGIKSGEDLLTWARLACRYKIAYCRRPLAVFVESKGDGTSKPTQRLGGEKYIAGQLIELYDVCNDSTVKAELKTYIARWFKVWCILQIEAQDNHRAFSIACRGIKWGGRLKHFMPIMVLSLLPAKLARSLFYKIRR